MILPRTQRENVKREVRKRKIILVKQLKVTDSGWKGWQTPWNIVYTHTGFLPPWLKLWSNVVTYSVISQCAPQRRRYYGGYAFPFLPCPTIAPLYSVFPYPTLSCLTLFCYIPCPVLMPCLALPNLLCSHLTCPPLPTPSLAPLGPALSLPFPALCDDAGWRTFCYSCLGLP